MGCSITGYGVGRHEATREIALLGPARYHPVQSYVPPPSRQELLINPQPSCSYKLVAIPVHSVSPARDKGTVSLTATIVIVHLGIVVGEGYRLLHPAHVGPTIPAQQPQRRKLLVEGSRRIMMPVGQTVPFPSKLGPPCPARLVSWDHVSTAHGVMEIPG